MTVSSRMLERIAEVAVQGLTLPANNGIVEGKMNKLKLIKRMGYGRAGFSLTLPACSARFVVGATQRRISVWDGFLPEVSSCSG